MYTVSFYKSLVVLHHVRSCISNDLKGLDLCAYVCACACVCACVHVMNSGDCSEILQKTFLSLSDTNSLKSIQLFTF